MRFFNRRRANLNVRFLPRNLWPIISVSATFVFRLHSEDKRKFRLHPTIEADAFYAAPFKFLRAPPLMRNCSSFYCALGPTPFFPCKKLRPEQKRFFRPICNGSEKITTARLFDANAMAEQNIYPEEHLLKI